MTIFGIGSERLSTTRHNRMSGQAAARKMLSEAERQKVQWLLTDDAVSFLNAIGGDAPAEMVAGRRMKVVHKGNLESTAEALKQTNKAVAKAMRKRKKGGAGKRDQSNPGNTKS